jgi:hypothetical protein
MSTAFEKVMRARGDLACFHEPFLYDYYVHRGVRPLPHFDVDPERPAAYEAIRDQLLARAETSPVFFKDMSYYVVPQIFDDPEFARRLTNSFLIRDPLKSILSYYKLDPDLTDEEIGLEAEWSHFQWLREATGADPVVVDAEAVQRDTEGVLQAYWERIGLSFRPEAFDWKGRCTPEDWQEVSGWHGDVSTSQGIRRPDPEDEAARVAAFEAKAAAAPKLRTFLDRHRPYYDKLRGFSLGA